MHFALFRAMLTEVLAGLTAWLVGSTILGIFVGRLLAAREKPVVRSRAARSSSSSQAA